LADVCAGKVPGQEQHCEAHAALHSMSVSGGAPLAAAPSRVAE
jgi:hypothetical protein